MYPCPCGYAGDAVKECTCSSSTITRYQKRILGPLLDRIHIEVPRVEYEKLSDSRVGEPSQAIRARIESARERQRERFSSSAITQSSIIKSPNGLAYNADMGPAEVRQYCELDATGRALMKTAMAQLQLSDRAYHRVLKLARSIADLAGAAQIGPVHLAEALQYRPKVGGM